MIHVVNFPFCNFFSLERYLRVKSHRHCTLDRKSILSSGDTILLPGVGTFKQGMDYLATTRLVSLIKEHAKGGGRVIGICLGMQILLDSSSESPGSLGLGLISGTCEKIPSNSTFSVPHIGWNSLEFPPSLHPSVQLLGVTNGVSVSDFYFVHSYVAHPRSQDCVIASFNHPDGLLTAAIAKSRVIGFQFHPEKSGSTGYALLDRVLEI